MTANHRHRGSFDQESSRSIPVRLPEAVIAGASNHVHHWVGRDMDGYALVIHEFFASLERYSTVLSLVKQCWERSVTRIKDARDDG